VSGPLVAGLMAAAFAVISTNWLQGNWGDTLTVVGPALAALSLINLPRGAVPEIVADAKDHPLLLAARAGGLVIGGVIGVVCQLPGLVGVALAVAGAVGGGVLAGLFSQQRRHALDALVWPDRPHPDQGAQGAGRNATKEAAHADASIDDPRLGLSRDLDELVRGQLDEALGISPAGVR
jgi:hypothetical protein